MKNKSHSSCLKSPYNGFRHPYRGIQTAKNARRNKFIHTFAASSSWKNDRRVKKSNLMFNQSKNGRLCMYF